MDLKQIEKLMSAMERSAMKRVVLKQEGFEIELERECASDYVVSAPRTIVEVPREADRAAPVLHQKEAKHDEAPSGEFVTSPMVGTFYAAPSPDDPPYIKIGDSVEEDSVLCIIEAMKVMNEVKAGVKGKVVEVLVKSGDPVEFGSKIFRISP